MRIIIEIDSAFLHEKEAVKMEQIKLETDCYYNFNEVVKCILQSGYIIKAYKMFDGKD